MGPFFLLLFYTVHNTAMYDADARRTAWSQYWATGSLHSCSRSFTGNYAGAIADFWRMALADVVPSTRVLDLATGNGALPQLLLQRYGNALSVDAVDAAQLKPDWFNPLQHPQIRFHSGMAIEALPFADVSFDYVISQYGIEYSTAPDGWRQALRVLRPKGYLACVMHHADSVLAHVAREEQKHFKWLLSDDGLLASASELLPWLLRARRSENLRDDPAAQHSRQAFNAVQQTLAARAAASSVPDLLLEARHVVQQVLSQPQPQSLLSQYADALRAAQLRGAELLQFALSSEQLEDLVRWLRAQRPDGQVQAEVLQQAQGIMGWGLLLRPN